jgi:LDH2 family malate/lactate/ureidoglycolate dehydrogenase
LVRDIRSSERLPGVERIWLPGEQSDARRDEYTTAGIPIAPAILSELDQLAGQLGVAHLVRR